MGTPLQIYTVFDARMEQDDSGRVGTKQSESNGPLEYLDSTPETFSASDRRAIE